MQIQCQTHRQPVPACVVRKSLPVWYPEQMKFDELCAFSEGELLGCFLALFALPAPCIN